jgi:hypothetical protein
MKKNNLPCACSNNKIQRKVVKKVQKEKQREKEGSHEE